jgi:SAM-dependent methyltransferase
MAKVNFDDYAEDYDAILKKQLRFFESGTDYFSRYKIALIKRLLQRTPSNILEFGCGVGNNIKYLLTFFHNASITGCDISAKSLDIARSRYPSAAFFLFTEATLLDIRFDLIFIANVFHHIPPKQRQTTIQLLKKLLIPGGNLFIFEHNPYNPVTRHLVNTCPFDVDAQLLRPREMISSLKHAGFSIIKRDFILFFPSALRLLRPIERYMSFMPLGGQYVVQAHLKETDDNYTRPPLSAIIS